MAGQAASDHRLVAMKQSAACANMVGVSSFFHTDYP